MMTEKDIKRKRDRMKETEIYRKRERSGERSREMLQRCTESD